MASNPELELELEQEEGYMPPSEFQEDATEPLFDLTSSDSSSTEFWLIQWPKNQNPDFDGQEITLKLDQDGSLGNFTGSSGKEYEVVSFASQAPNATVFVSSASGTKIAGKISRRVSLVHYSEPHELEQLKSSNLKRMYQQSSSMTLNNSANKFGTPAQSSRPGNSRSTSRRPASTHSSKHKSSLSYAAEPSETPMIRHAAESSRSVDRSTHSSGRGQSEVTYSGSSERSHQGNPKKKKYPVE